MNDLVKAYQQYLENCVNSPDLYSEPISLKVLSDCGLSESNIVVYLRFVDLLRSCAMVDLTSFLGRGSENRKAHETIDCYGQRIMDDYIAFISDLTGLVIKPEYNAYRYMSFGIGSITYSYTFKSKMNWMGDKDYRLNSLFLSFDDFRADLDMFTAHMILGHPLKWETDFDSDEEKVKKLSTAELLRKITEAEDYISKHDDERYSEPEIQNAVTYSDIIESARTLENWHQIIEELGEYESQLELYKDELDRRKKEEKKAAMVNSLYMNNIRKPLAVAPPPITWEKQESRPYCKCRYPSCRDNSFRDGYCWFHYQEENYLCK